MQMSSGAPRIISVHTSTWQPVSGCSPQGTESKKTEQVLQVSDKQ